jgi:hypothetical protein
VKLGIQGNNLTLKIINETAVSLGLPSNQSFINRRIARAFDLVEGNKVAEVTDGIFRVHSQYEPNKSYIVNLNHGEPSCNCPDGERTINCKHRIAALLFSQKQAKPLFAIIKTTDGEEGDYWRRCWCIAQGNDRPMVYEERDRSLFCNCDAHYEDCEHKQLVIRAVKKELFDLRIVNECGSNEAKQLQNKLNGQLDSQENWVRCKRAMLGAMRCHDAFYHTTPSTDTTPSTGNGVQAPSQPAQLDLSDPFQEAEALDIDQIEGRKNGELYWKLRNGEYVISYAGIMKLAEKHEISFDELSVNLDTVIAKAKNGNERISGKPIYDNANTAIELAKRNAARQLLPLPEIKAVEHKAKLESEFDWQKAKVACLKLVPEYNLSILINDLVNAGKLRQDNPSHYDRTEWLMIHDYCKKDAKAQAEIDPDGKSLNRWSYNSVVFLEECGKLLDAMRAEKQVEANEQPLQNSNGKRKLQMDKKLRTWLVEADGTKTEISCREICEQFESKQNPSIVTRLRAGIDSGADISTVEID